MKERKKNERKKSGANIDYKKKHGGLQNEGLDDHEVKRDERPNKRQEKKSKGKEKEKKEGCCSAYVQVIKS